MTLSEIDAEPKDEGLLDPDMPAQELRLHCGEMTAQEKRTARAVIRWANSRIQSYAGVQSMPDVVRPAPAPITEEQRKHAICCMIKAVQQHGYDGKGMSTALTVLEKLGWRPS